MCLCRFSSTTYSAIHTVPHNPLSSHYLWYYLLLHYYILHNIYLSKATYSPIIVYITWDLLNAIVTSRLGDRRLVLELEWIY